YYVSHGRHPVRDFSGGRPQGLMDVNDINIWEKAYPVLFPYGVGGFEAVRTQPIPLLDHVRWALEFHDARFQRHPMFPFHAFSLLQRRQILASAKAQISKADFEAIVPLLGGVTREALMHAGEEECRGDNITNPSVEVLCQRVHRTIARVVGSDASRESIRAEIWATVIQYGLPSVWLTINPDDLHDPIVQVFAGKAINLDAFDPLLGPSKSQHAANVASDPYATAKFFNFVVSTIFETLIGVQSTPFSAHSTPGIFGDTTAYVGVVE
ncbi:hypothetical protein BC834DRAFT_791938, partial [Gloeopeniophorella convolvens]